MNYADEMCSGAMIHIRSFIKVGLGIEKFLVGGIHTDTQRAV
jgi:hypothetical protein